MIKIPSLGKVTKHYWIALLIALLMLSVIYLTYHRYRAANDNLDNLSVQLDKVLTAAQLQQNLVAQSYYMKGYMLYQDPKYLRDFRWLAEVNKRDIQELYEIVRPARKPLVAKIAGLQQQYTEICEAEIIPLVQKGDTAGVIELIMNTNLLAPLEQSISYAEELENMRALDTQALFSSVIEMTRRDILEAFTMIMLILTAAGIIGIPLAGRAARENNIYRLILTTTKNAIIIINRNEKVALINRVAEEIFGIARLSVMGRPFKEVFTGRKRTGEIAFSYPVDSVLRTGQGVCNNEKSYTDDEGWTYHLLVDCLPLQENGDITGVLLLLRDKTERKVIEDKLKGLAVRDGMTLIYNHSHLKKVLSREVEQASSRGGFVSFMLLDLDNFKFYNDSFGHPVGDQLLKELALLVQKHVRVQDTVGRYGGDEFAVILPGTDLTAAREAAERLRAAIENFPFPYSKLMPGGKVTVSVGLACYPFQAKNAAELVRLADEAMYRAKRTTKNKVEVYSSVLEELALEEWNGENFFHSLEVMMGALKTKDPYTFSHSEKVAFLANRLAKEAMLDNEMIGRVTMAGLLHDFGKLEIPAEILNKSGPLTNKEWETVRRHSELGMDVVGQIKPFENLASIILHHHEHYNGRGYPDGLAGDEIPLEARIIAIADAYDAMTSYRIYRPARTSNEALVEIERKAGVQFDPHLAGVFIKLFSNNRGGGIQGCILKKGETQGEK